MTTLINLNEDLNNVQLLTYQHFVNVNNSSKTTRPEDLKMLHQLSHNTKECGD